MVLYLYPPTNKPPQKVGVSKRMMGGCSFYIATVSNIISRYTVIHVIHYKTKLYTGTIKISIPPSSIYR